jgi:hypothetical protein
MQFRIAAVFFAALLGLGACRTAPPISNGPAADGSFRVECVLSHRAQVDPIVAPGRPSGHMHDFFGNRSTGANSTYASMQSGSTNCTLSGDKAGYWVPDTDRLQRRDRRARAQHLLLPQPPHRVQRDRCLPAELPHDRRRFLPQLVLDLRRRAGHRHDVSPELHPELRRRRKDQTACVLPVVLGRAASRLGGSSEPCRVRSRQQRCGRRN